MKIAFVHYHLKTGGVTTVLKRQIEAVHGPLDTFVLTGDRAAADLPCQVVEIPELGYDRQIGFLPAADRVAEKMLKVLNEKWPGGCDVLHVHNPTLGKNRQFLQIIKKLQQAGVNLFLQIHDFAEDGRPDLYFEEDYPANCHYGVINARDAAILKQAGLDVAGLHTIPNAVESLAVSGNRCPKPQILYPVRAIRRKNLGEAILLSLFFKNDRRLAVTQPPNSPADAASYRDWIDWVRENRLRVDFEVGKKNAFPLLVGNSESMVTTSVSEGFGLAFLEPWTAGKLLWGRRLGDICGDFEKKGIRLDFLYDRLDVPLVWLDADAFSRVWHDSVFSAMERYGHTVAADTVNQAFDRLTRDERIDFGLLSEKFQRQVLTRLIADASVKAELISLNPWLAHPGEVADASAIIENNRTAALQHYGVNPYRDHLLEIYDRIVNHPVRHRIDKRALRDAFLDFDRFSLLQWGTYDG
ncbi:hypothetical protein [uncultured Desulfosarcina sp.]|uniref:hypothetical protein n=1 Tax=uncultured Desulfosarcina sp. TaxID=218289 RepID=UPI0029C6DCE5|nr:hypothetical protein [uncultured Desulfosarcina sp.]